MQRLLAGKQDMQIPKKKNGELLTNFRITEVAKNSYKIHS